MFSNTFRAYASRSMNNCEILWWNSISGSRGSSTSFDEGTSSKNIISSSESWELLSNGSSFTIWFKLSVCSSSVKSTKRMELFCGRWFVTKGCGGGITASRIWGLTVAVSRGVNARLSSRSARNWARKIFSRFRLPALCLCFLIIYREEYKVSFENS